MEPNSDLMITGALCLILAGLGFAYLLLKLREEHAARVAAERRAYLSEPPPSDGVLLTGNAGREALGATLRQLEGEENPPVLCEMSGRHVNHVGLITCPGCVRYVDVDTDGRVEPHWTKPALPLPAERYAGGLY